MNYDIELGYIQNDTGTDEFKLTKSTRIEDGSEIDTKISITYNYNAYYEAYLDRDNGIRWIYNKTGAETENKLREAIREIEALDNTEYNDVPDDIKAVLEKGAARLPRIKYLNLKVASRHTGSYSGSSYTPLESTSPLKTLLRWAIQHPEAIWQGN